MVESIDALVGRRRRVGEVDWKGGLPPRGRGGDLGCCLVGKKQNRSFLRSFCWWDFRDA